MNNEQWKIQIARSGRFDGAAGSMCLACAPVANPEGCESEFGSRQTLLASSATLNTYDAGAPGASFVADFSARMISTLSYVEPPDFLCGVALLPARWRQ